MQLSWHFHLDDFVRSDTATRLGIENVPGPKEIANMKRLCAQVLEPLWGWCGPLYLSSGFRCLELNRALKSKDSSEHVQGRAADIVCLQGINVNPLKFAKFVAGTNTIGYNQVIHEFGRWVHVSIPAEGQTPKRQVLTIDYQGTREGLHEARPKVAPKVVPKEKAA